MTSANDDQEFKIWVTKQTLAPGHIGTTGAVLKKGAGVCKTVTVSLYGNPENQTVSKRELRFRTAPRSTSGPGYDFDRPTARWAIENDEINRLVAFLSSDVAETGRFRIVDMDSPAAAILDLLDAEGRHRGDRASTRWIRAWAIRR